MEFDKLILFIRKSRDTEESKYSLVRSIRW